MIQVLVTSSVLIAAILVLRKILRHRASPRTLYLLWALVALRLMLPVSVPLSSSVMNRVDTAPAQEFIEEHIVYLSPQRTTQPITGMEEAPVTQQPRPIEIPWLTLLWIGGSVIAGGYFSVLNLRFYKRLLKKRKRLSDAHSRLPVYVVEGLASPCLFGLLHPCIYLTPRAAQDPKTCSHVLVHELCHYRQRDHIWSLVRILCLTLYWFDPFVWAAAVCSRTDSELACDQLVIESIGEEQRVPYGKTLLELVEHSQSISELGCTATTMSGRPSKIKERITALVHAPKTTIRVAAAMVLCALVLVSCTFTGKTETQTQEEPSSEEAQEGPLSLAQAADMLVKSLSAKDGVVSFTIPKSYPYPDEWNISVYGTAANINGYTQAPIFLFEENNSDNTWEAGKTYQVDLKERSYLDLCLEILVVSKENEEIHHQVDLMKLAGVEPAVGWQTVSITFPSYPDSGLQQYEGMQVEPFDVRMRVPSSWSFTIPGESMAPVCSAIQISDTQHSIGSIGFLPYEPTQEATAPEDEYKSVLTELRMGRMEIWGDYTPVRRTQNGEIGMVDITYMDPEYRREHPDAAWASVPEKETIGITVFDRERRVYAALRFDSKSAVSEQDLQSIANSMELVSSDYGAGGRRYPGDYAQRDYSSIQIIDSQGNDISKILIDLWYCASDIYDVEGNVMFRTGESSRMEADGPEYTQLLDYEQVMQTVFTTEGIEQYEASPVVDLHKQDGTVYRLGAWKTGYGYGQALVDMETLELTQDEIRLHVKYEAPSAMMASMMPDYQPQYQDTLFTVKRIDGIWYVKEYWHPEDQRYREKREALFSKEK